MEAEYFGCSYGSRYASGVSLSLEDPERFRDELEILKTRAYAAEEERLREKTECSEEKQENPAEEGESEMSNSNKAIDVARSAGSDIAKALSEGWKISGSQGITEGMVRIIRERMGDSYPDFFNTPLGREAEALVIPAMALYLTRMFADRIPHHAAVERVCTRAITGVGKDQGDKIIRALSGVWEQIAALEENLPELTDGDPSEQEKEEGKKQEKGGKNKK